MKDEQKDYIFSAAERDTVADIQRDIKAQYARLASVLTLIRRQQELKGDYTLSEDGTRLVPVK